MLHRSSSSRRRRASRSAASPQIRPSRSAASSPGRRASIAVSPVDGSSRNVLLPENNRSPRHSIIPNISLDTQSFRDNYADDLIHSPRLSTLSLSPRNSLIPDSSHRSPRHSLVPNESYSRSPRTSLIPESSLSPRNSLIPDNFNRSGRNSLIPDINRTSRHSLTPDNHVHGSKLSLAPDYNRSSRPSIVSIDNNKSPRPSITPADVEWIESPEGVSRSPRHNFMSDSNRSPRGSIGPEKVSPRGSITGDHASTTDEKSPRGSITHENENRSPRGSFAKNMLGMDEYKRSSRGSLSLTFQEPPGNERRSSADNPSGSRTGGRLSPYRTSSRGAVNTAYGSNSGFSESGSRRASSSVGLPQVSGDEQRRLCNDQKYNEEGIGIGISLTTYGSVAYQLKDANLEATGTLDFICKALSIVNKTVVVTVILVCLSSLPLLMLIMGIQFLRDCPREPNIPIYMVVGGSIGGVKMGLTLYNQLTTRRPETTQMDATTIGAKVASIALTIFLIIWFGLGNYWIYRIKWPDYAPTLFEPNFWCHRTLYVFSLIHLYIIYTAFACFILLIILLAACQLFECSWLGPSTYK